ncbi:DUF6773 family protein [Paenibacillus donghaensis]|uniref:Uncharacterized protein n=1 Tax=Paenibacillus donghaensis TaxID=414771 RepID=A0A2Z2KBS3_9BACL|nr:DUF6773 family protein [Paenibacillus donghaensis]ASA21155.1 hypothetical protein B9T62_10360 [Paenibacillus donghaensis]
MNKSHLDERQLQKRNKVGNQTLLLVACLLLADLGLQDSGIQWLDYPLNNYFIFMVSIGSYVVRIIWIGSFTGPGNSRNALFGKKTLGAAVAILVAISTVALFLGNSSGTTAERMTDMWTLAGISVLVAVVILTVVVITRIRNNRD